LVIIRRLVGITVVLAPLNFGRAVTLFGLLARVEAVSGHLDLDSELRVKRNLPAEDTLLEFKVRELTSLFGIVHLTDVIPAMLSVAVAGRGDNVGVKCVGHEYILSRLARIVKDYLLPP
jgi:hypothetical protein